MTAKAKVVQLPTIADYMLAEKKDAFCDQIKELAGTPNLHFTFCKSGLLVKQAPLHGSIRKSLLINLRPIILYMAHHFILIGHPANAEFSTPYVAITTGLA